MGATVFQSVVYGYTVEEYNKAMDQQQELVWTVSIWADSGRWLLRIGLRYGPEGTYHAERVYSFGSRFDEVAAFFDTVKHGTTYQDTWTRDMVRTARFVEHTV